MLCKSYDWFLYDREISLMKQLMYQAFITLFLNNDLKSALFYVKT